MLIDMHAHSSGISRCCRADARTVLDIARRVGIDGLILTNHYHPGYVDEKGSAAFAEKYVKEYESAKEAADEIGVRLFFGLEVTARKYNNAHILLYGIPTEAVIDCPDMYDLTLQEMQALVKPYDGIVVQAHPFRSGGSLLDISYLDGVEVNCHPFYDATHADRLLKIAGEEKLLVTCGGDFHDDTPRPVCGVHFPDTVSDIHDIIRHVRSASEVRLHVQEVGATEHADRIFRR